MMNQASTYTLPMYYDLELIFATVTHTRLPPFCTFLQDAYRFEPINHFGQYEVSGYISDSLNQQNPFSFKVEVINT
jgi:hypothetical protein